MPAANDKRMSTKKSGSREYIERYKITKNCRHPELPEFWDHQDGKDGSRNDRPFLVLKLNSYDPVSLQNFTCAGFLFGNLQPHQNAAREAFTSLYLSARDRAWHWDQFLADKYSNECINMNISDSWDGACSIAEEEAFFENCMQDMMKYIDEYFFFGLLTRRHDIYARPLVKLITGYRDFQDKNSVPIPSEGDLGEASSTPYMYPYHEIRIWSLVRVRKGIRSQSFFDRIITLIHEMLHVYLDLFVCTGRQCSNNVLNTTGITGHGIVFIGMNALIMQDVSQWHPYFKTALFSENWNDSFVGLLDFFHERDEYRYQLKAGHLENYLPLAGRLPGSVIEVKVVTRDKVPFITAAYQQPNFKPPVELPSRKRICGIEMMATALSDREITDLKPDEWNELRLEFLKRALPKLLSIRALKERGYEDWIESLGLERSIKGLECEWK